jgi:hypothetical protein
MNLKRTLYNSIDNIMESVEDNFDTIVYDYGIKTDRHEIFNNMPFQGINPPSNASLLTYITLPITFDNMLITNSFFALKKSAISINEVKTFLENQFGDTVYILSTFRYTMSGKVISNQSHNIKILYCTLINFSY